MLGLVLRSILLPGLDGGRRLLRNASLFLNVRMRLDGFGALLRLHFWGGRYFVGVGGLCPPGQRGSGCEQNYLECGLQFHVCSPREWWEMSELLMHS